ncbi:MAG: radical SAM protein [Anaerolineae bacterium]
MHAKAYPKPDPRSATGPSHRPSVTLVPFSIEAAIRPAGTEPDSQCDCACYAVEGQELPPLSAPVSFYLELTSTCQNHCPSCGNVFVTAEGRLQGEAPVREHRGGGACLPASTWQKILDRLAPYAFRLKLTGGEPTLHPEFETIVEQVAALDIPFSLLTNGRWPRARRVVDLLKGVPRFEGVLISLHGPDAAHHQAFTHTPGSFEQALVGMRLAVSAGLPASLSCVITAHNWHMVDEMLQLGRRLGAQSVVFNRYLGKSSLAASHSMAGTGNLAPEDDELLAAVERILALRAAGEPVRLGNCLPACFAESDQGGCLAGLAFFTVDPWGQVRPCNHAPLICGNLLEQSVDEIWHSPGMEQWRGACPAACHACPALATCRGGCRAEALLWGDGADPLMRAPLPARQAPAPQPLRLYERARPLARFRRRDEAFGPLLICGNRILPLAAETAPVLAHLDGHTTLRQIEVLHGAAGLSLVGRLYQEGMIDLLN